MPRPKFGRAARVAILSRPDNPHGPGRCWHCGVALTDGWHVDHYPVRFADIESQLCVGVRDARDPANLVCSCPACNTSHAFEGTAWCGHSQCRCTPCVVAVVCVLLAAAAVIAWWLAAN